MKRVRQKNKSNRDNNKVSVLLTKLTDKLTIMSVSSSAIRDGRG
jgi:hypothetical protein